MPPRRPPQAPPPPPPPAAPPREEVLLETGPSQLKNAVLYTFLPVVLVIAVGACWWLAATLLRTHPTLPHPVYATLRVWLPFAIALLIVGRLCWAWATVAFTRYTITNERLIITSGVFDQLTEEVELRRVRDFAVKKPIDLRPLGLGHVQVIAADPSDPISILIAIRRPDAVHDLLRNAVQDAWQRYGVRDLVVNTISDHGLDATQPSLRF